MKAFQLRYEISPTHTVDPGLLKKNSGKLLLDIEGKLEIWVDEQCFFVEKSFPLLEFAVDLSRWRGRIEKTLENFHYYSMEHDYSEGPIISFLYTGSGSWELASIWQEFEYSGPLALPVVLDEVDLFIAKFDQDLLRRYGIRVSNFYTLFN
ncbi:DUF7878 domain-containing protein [Paenibacillus soyae]|uniref:DUF7878 domain-containing protein n=1 Tax=Paenibacillus soyae TaxID=2969249 RepID=A0A9X2MTR3_9BACL|nr:hypothetical protein [Paenibacillus soyae]MCR2806846.1 hypothetical protein [Paenibacillus soyae]